MSTHDAALQRVRLLALDVDGILTDGRVWFAADGEALKPFHTQDGLGIKLVIDRGIQVALVTGRVSPMVDFRARQLGIQHVIQGRDDKLAAITELTNSLGLTLDQVAYMGDDLPDLSALLAVGVGRTVPGGDPWVRARVPATEAAGGFGAVRELCNELLRAQGHEDAVLSAFGVAE